MWYELQGQWFTAIFVALGALIILLGVARLLYVWRRNFEPKDSIRTAFAPSLVETGLTPSQVVEAQRDLYRSFHRASPWAIIGTGAGIILASLAQLALVTLIYQPIGDLQNTSPDYRALALVESGAVYGLLFGGMAVGAGAGLLFGVGLTPRDTSLTKAPARGIFDLISPGIVVVAFAPILALLGFSGYCATNFPLRQTAEPLLETFPWLPYAGPAFMASAFVFVHLCILIICRMKPRQWTLEESRAEWADRYCRTRLVASLYGLTLTQFAAFGTQLTTLGKLYPNVNNLIEQWPLLLPSTAILSLFLLIGFFIFIVPHAQLGQLGGRLTGWPWRPRDTATQPTA